MHNNKAQGEKPQHINRFWIIGAGHFGQIAISRIARRYPDAVLTVVDKRPVRCRFDSITSVCADGITWLTQHLMKDKAVDMVIPIIPEHVALGWLTIHLKRKGLGVKKIPINERLLMKLPNAMAGEPGKVFVSHADFLCPDNCPEPKARCTYTGKPRPLDMFRLLAALEFDDMLSIVLRSHQVLPGVGGIHPEDLWTALDVAEKNSHRPLMVATACRCHGVVDLVQLETHHPL